MQGTPDLITPEGCKTIPIPSEIILAGTEATAKAKVTAIVVPANISRAGTGVLVIVGGRRRKKLRNDGKLREFYGVRA